MITLPLFPVVVGALILVVDLVSGYLTIRHVNRRFADLEARLKVLEGDFR